ncbi:MAG: ThuA domain-containing protein [Fibrobacteria bacterium]
MKKVTLFIDYGGSEMLHPEVVPAFVAMMNALSTEHQFTLTITQPKDSAAQKQAALADMKNQDVVLFANCGEYAFPNKSDQAIIQIYFANGGKAIGYHETIHNYPYSGYWPWWTDSLHDGSYFVSNGHGTFSLDMDPEVSNVPALKNMWEENSLGTANISAYTEIWGLNKYPRGKPGVTIMQTVMPTSALDSESVHEFTWLKKWPSGGGEYIYTCLGHGSNDFVGDWLKKATWAWMQYLNGKYDAVPVLGRPKLDGDVITFSANHLDVSYAKSYSVKVMNLNGAVILFKNGQGNRSYDLSGLQPGFYFVRVSGPSNARIKRILIK